MTQAPPDLSPNAYVLADRLACSPPERRLLAALCARRNGAGLLPALRTAVPAMAAAAMHHPSTRAKAWVGIARRLLERVASEAKQAYWLDIVSPTAGGRSVHDALADPARAPLAPEQQQRLDAWLGMHIFHALAQGSVLSRWLLDAWEMLRRSGAARANTSASWIQAAKHMPLTAEELNRMLPSVKTERLKDALKLTLVAVQADIPDPDTSGNTFTLSTAEDLGPAASFAEDELEDKPGADPEDDEEDAGSNGQPSWQKHSLMGLLLHRALHATSRGQFGVTSVYGELPPPELRRVCQALAATLKDGTEADCTRAAVAELSLKLSLSPRHTLQLPLQRNDDVWIDIQGEAIVWNFDRVLETRERGLAGADGKGRCKPIPIRLSKRCVGRLNKLVARQPKATSLRELCGIWDDAEAITGWLREYGEFLRAHSDLNYPAYSVRFARSYRSVYLARGHGAIAAAMLGLDFATVPGGMLHYISLPAERLITWQRDVDSYLGLQ